MASGACALSGDAGDLTLKNGKATLTSTPTRGDFLIANSTPAWSRLARGTANQMCGMAASGLDPEWKSLLGATGISVVHAAGEIDLILQSDLQGISVMSATGLAVRSGGGFWTTRSIFATAPVSITNGDGLGGNPTITISDAVKNAGDEKFDVRTGGVLCNNTADQTTAFNAVVAAVAGGTVIIPNGCMVRLQSAPSALPSGTKILCDGPSAGFQLSTRTCVGGTFVGDYCTADADCPSSTCGTTTAFAPTGATTYPVLTAASASSDVSLVGCKIKTGGLGVHLTCTNGARVGKTCSLDTTDATTGCGAGATCPGCCASPSLAISGPGFIDPVNFSNSTRAVIRDVQLEDHTKGNLAFEVASYGLVENTKNVTNGATNAAHYRNADCTALRTPAICCSGVATGTCDTGFLVSDGIVLGPSGETGATVRGNEARGSRYVIHILGDDNFITNNHVMQGNVTDTAVGFWLDGPARQNVITGNFVELVYYGLRGNGFFTDNVTYMGNRNLYGDGPKVLCNGAGWKIQNNYLAWGANTTVIGLNDNTTGGKASACVHPHISGNTLYTPASSSYIRAFDIGKRCTGGTKFFELCVNDNTTDCPGATCPSCCIASQATTGIQQGVIVDNLFLNAVKGLDLSALINSANTPLTELFVGGNMFTGNTTAVAMPASTGKVTKVYLGANTYSNTTDALNPAWDWNFGGYDASTPLNPGDESPVQAFFTNKTGSTSVLYQAVIQDATNDNAVKQAPASTTAPIAGVFLEVAATNVQARVGVGGTTKCAVSGAVVHGDRLGMSATAGLFATAAATQPAAAIAMASGTNTNVLCVITPSPAKKIHSMSWFVPGLPTAGAQAMVGIVPAGLTNCTVTAATLAIGTFAAVNSTWNIQRCTANCTGSAAATYASIWASDDTVNNNKFDDKATGALTATITAGDFFKVTYPTVGAGTADYTATLAYVCDQ